MKQICVKYANGECDGYKRTIELCWYARPNNDTGSCSEFNGNVVQIEYKREAFMIKDDEVVEITAGDLRRMAKEAGSHSYVIEAIKPEVFKPEMEFVVGGVYKCTKGLYEGTYWILSRTTSANLYRLVNLTDGIAWTRDVNNIKDVSNDCDTKFIFVGKASDVLEVKS